MDRHSRLHDGPTERPQQRHQSIAQLRWGGRHDFRSVGEAATTI